MYLDADKLGQAEMYKLLIGTVQPRPIAWVGSRSAQGTDNLAPFSFYNAFSTTPPIVGFATIPQADGKPKDSLRNIQESGCFTLNSVSHALAEAMSRTAATLPPGESEFEYAGLAADEARHIDAPCVRDSLIVFECKLREVISFGTLPASGTLVLGEVMHIRLHESVYRDGRIDTQVLDPVARLAGNFYCTARERFELKRG